MTEGISVFLSLVLGSLFMGTTAQVSQNERLYWCERKIAWSDFAMDSSYVPEDNYYAIIVHSYEIRGFYNSEGLPDYIINTFMDTKSSWAVPGKKNDWALGHEQLHFDISEVFARKLRRSIDSLNNIRVNKETTYRMIIRKWLKSERSENERFDRESDHGRKMEVQNSWREKTSTELNELSEFALSEDKCGGG